MRLRLAGSLRLQGCITLTRCAYYGVVGTFSPRTSLNCALNCSIRIHRYNHIHNEAGNPLTPIVVAASEVKRARPTNAPDPEFRRRHGRREIGARRRYG